ncbi:MAG: carbohydrate ABC transporter permease, partial [Spirochaetia bacterium]
MNIPMERQPMTAGRIIRSVVIFLIAVAWLVPTVGLLVTSFRPQSDIAASGWWQIVVTPRFTTDNYNAVLSA